MESALPKHPAKPPEPSEEVSRATRLLAAPAANEEDFYATAAEALCIGTGSRRAGVSLVSPDGGTVAVCALWSPDEGIRSLSFPVAGAPCREALAKAVVGTAQLFEVPLARFPDSPLLEEGSEAIYRAECFFSIRGRPAGLVFTIGSDPMDGDSMDTAEARRLFGWVRARVESEYRRARTADEEENLRRIVDLSEDYIALIDMSYGFRQINPAYREAFGWESHSTLPRSISELHGARAFEAGIRPILDRCFDGESVRTERWFDVPGRRRQFLDVSAVPDRDVDGEIRGAILSLRDLTSRQVALQERRGRDTRSEEERRAESLGVLASGVAHDFSNLLVGVLGGADLLLTEGLSEEGQRTARTVKQSALDASNLCRQMLACAGQAPVETARTEISHLVRNTVATFAASLPESVSVELDLASDRLHAEIDPTLASQAILSLIANSAEAYDGGGGTVYVASGAANIDQSFLGRINAPTDTQPGPCVFVQVRDHGHGVELDLRRRIFDPFFTTKSGHRGLGLAATRGILRIHGGCVQFDSLPGAGTTVRIFFPALSSAGLPSAAESQDEKRGTILVVDDEPMVVDITCKILEKAGFDALSAASASEAATLLSARTDEIDMILLDVGLPGSSCKAVVDRLLTIDPTARIVLCSGHSSRSPELLPILPKCYGFVAKPFSSDVLIQKIEDTVCHRSS